MPLLGTDHLTCRRGLWFFVSFRIFFSDNTRVTIFILGRAPVHCYVEKPIMLLKRPCAALTWMKSYLNDRSQLVAVGSVVSNSMHLHGQLSIVSMR
jgi:hypothetical protein